MPTDSVHAFSILMYLHNSMSVNPLTKCVYVPLTLKCVSVCLNVYVLPVNHSVNAKTLSFTRLSTRPNGTFHLMPSRKKVQKSKTRENQPKGAGKFWLWTGRRLNVNQRQESAGKPVNECFLLMKA